MQRFGKRSRRLITRCGRWRGFPQSPASDTRKKQAMFVHLAAIIAAIIKAGGTQGFTATMQLAQHLTQVDGSDDAATLPDGCIVPSGNDKDAWESVAAIGWYSKSAEPVHTYTVSAACLMYGTTHTVPCTDFSSHSTQPRTWHERSTSALHVRVYTSQRVHGPLVRRPYSITCN